jgi:hypothetical protein
MDEVLKPKVIELLKRVYPFRLLDEEDQSLIADAGEVVRFDANLTLYEQGAPAEYFHIIMDGSVNISYNTGKMEVSMGLIESDDLFGVEVIEAKPVYRTAAVGFSVGMLFRMKRESVLELLTNYPNLVLPLQMLAHSLRLSLEVYLDWRSPDETLYYIDRRHPYFLVARLFFPIIFFAASLVVLTYLALASIPGTLLAGFAAGAAGFLTGFWVIWNYVDWTNDYSIITNRRVVFQERVVLLYDSRQEAPMEAVLASAMESSQFSRIVGYGNLIIKTYTGTLAFPDLRHPEVVHGFLDDRRTHVANLNEQEERKKLRRLIRNRLGFVPGTPPGKPSEKQVKSGTLAAMLANLFRMRWEQNNVITYRKHWFILLQRIFFPTLITTAWVVVVILSEIGVLTLLHPLTMLGLGFVVFLILVSWWAYQYADWANDIYIVSDDTIIDVYKKPLGSEEKRQAPIRSIQSVEFERLGILGLVLNYGTVYIRIGDARFTFDTVYNPSEVQRELFVRIDRHNYREKQREAEAARQKMLDVVEAYHTVMGDPYERTEKGDSKPSSGTTS